MKNIKEIEGKVEDLRIFETIGEASMCWEPRPSNEVFDGELASKIGNKLQDDIKLLLSSSLTSLLEGLKKSLPDISSDGDTEWADGYNTYRKEVIKLIDNCY